MPQIICQDALKWLKEQDKHSIQTIVTGIPDLDEINQLQTKDIPKKNYISFFQEIVSLLFEKTSKDGYVILMQTDRKMDGEWIDKSFLANQIAQKYKIKLLWSKIIHNRDGIYLQRPTYTHLLCFSYNGTPGVAFKDVIECGKHFYKNASSPNATCYVMDFLKKKNISLIVDPFVGKGTIPFIANHFNIDFIGIDIDPEQCNDAQKIFTNKKMTTILKNCEYFQ